MRIKTGIPGFDKLIQGGFPENSSILIAGSPGTGKTIFALQYLFNGAVKFNENGLYVTIEEKPSNLKKQAKLFGWDFDKLKNKIQFLKIPVDTANLDIIHLIKRHADKIKAKRVVIDSLSILSINASMYRLPINVENQNTNFTRLDIQPYGMAMSEETKQFIYVLISKLNEINANILYITDAPEKETQFITRDTVSEFACDGIILLSFESLGGEFSRSLLIRKLRQTNHDEDIHPLEISTNGLVVHKLK
jgi:KaiC/GvpD/RAD55 family RecA-like ATPase